MSIQINYKNKGLKGPSGNPVLFVDENFNIRDIKKFISKNECDRSQTVNPYGA